MTSRTHFTSAATMRRHLHDLHAEHVAAEREGLLQNDTYRGYLEREIAIMQSAYVGAAVTEIATLRGQLDGRNWG